MLSYGERIIACFKALATGDAIGKQTEMLSHADVRHWYPGGISGFHGSPGDIIPRYAGNQKREWRIGETTDDTEQSIAVARAVLSEQGVSHTAVGKELLKCRKSVHPDVKSMWTFHQLGNPSRTAADGDGCGAAMRIAPVGVLYSPRRFDELVRGAYESSIPTHGGQLAICAAAAVAAAISAAIEGMPPAEVLELATEAARKAEAFAPATKGKTTRSIAVSIQEMHVELSRHDTLQADELAEKYFPDRPQTKVPLALNLALITESAEQTILLATNVGGDSDSVASIGAAIAGSLRPGTVNETWFRVVQSVNGDDFVEMAQALAKLRC
ncbi:MAG TPA: ADP-ribosylglycohydrolase family protein [Candidatus Acidoferrales bacterium]|nr:ADP-ribosylglycohydrolase family protein [Candidatus Acidoferrales bacterium]